MTGKQHYLALGYHGVICRSADDHAEGLSAAEVERKEHGLFRDTFPSLVASGQAGVAKLKSKLSPLLDSLIDVSLVEISSELAAVLKDKEGRLEQLGQSLETASERRSFLTRCAKEMRGALARIGDGASTPGLAGNKSSLVAELRGRHDAFCELVRQLRLRIHNASEAAEQTEADLVAHLIEHLARRRGRELPSCVNETVFAELFAELVVTHWKAPTQQLCQHAEALLREHLATTHGRLFDGCPALKQHWGTVTNSAVSSAVEDAKKTLDSELAYYERENHVSDHYFVSCVMTERAKDFWAHVERSPAIAQAIERGEHHVSLADIRQACLSFGTSAATDRVSNNNFDARSYLHLLRAYWKSAHKIFIEHVWQIVGDTLVRRSIALAEVSSAPRVSQSVSQSHARRILIAVSCLATSSLRLPSLRATLLRATALPFAQTALDDLLGQPELATNLLAEHPRAIVMRLALREEIKMLREGVEVTNLALGKF